MRKFPVLLGALIFMFVLSSCNLVNPVFTFTCTFVNLTADYGEYTVDNTGTGHEAVFVRVYDGYGNLILNDDQTDLVGSNSTDIDTNFTYTTAPQANPLRVELFSPAGHDLANDTVWYSATGSCPGLPDTTGLDVFQDGRINFRDDGAPFVLYKVDDHYEIYWVEGQSKGTLEMTLTPDQIDAVPNPPAENTLIATSDTHDVQVYRLTDGRLHFRAKMANGKTYIVLLADDGTYESLEEQ